MRALAQEAPVERNRRAAVDRLVVAIFAGSGAAGLVYQVVWARELVLVFGNTSQAVSTIVAAFMAGLGFGALVAGVISARLRRPLLVYAVTELAVAGTALLVPLGLQGVEVLYRSALQTNVTTQLAVLRLALTMAVITPVTFLMGLTLPFLTRYLVTSLGTAGPRMGSLYSANTLGAVAGTVVSGLILIELLGLTMTSRVAVALNILAGVVALGLVLRGEQPRPQAAGPVGSRVVGRLRAMPGLRFAIYASTFVAGLVALALEVLWTRMLAEGTGSLAYNFVAILAVYLLGIGLGGAFYRTLSSPRRDTPVVLALALCGVALFTLVTVPLGGLFIGPNYTPADPERPFGLLRVIVLLPATVCMGYSFPLAARLLTSDPAESGRSIGVLYACNTCGSIVGSLSATFVLAPTLGTNLSVLLLGAANAVVALGLISVAAVPRRSGSLGLTPIPLVLVLLPILLIATGSPMRETSTDRLLDASHQPYHHVEDSLSTVDAVGGPPGRRQLITSGTAMTSLSVDTKLMAYLPKAIDPSASRFLDIGFGMGTTFRSGINLGLHTDVVDLSPSVPQQMPTFYADAQHYLHSPLGHVITADGRNYVRFTDRRYDIISVDPPPPIQSADGGILYTKEFYGEGLSRLRAHGVMVEWLYFGVTMQQLKEQLRTFWSSFPYVDFLLSPLHGGIYMIGSPSPIQLDAATMTRTLSTPEARHDLSGAPDYREIAGVPWSAELDRMEWLHGGQVNSLTAGAPLITDDHPLTEYFLLQMWSSSASHQFVRYRQLRRLRPPPG